MYTYTQLRKIQDNREAVNGRRYEQDNGDIYVGTNDRRLKLLTNASNVTFVTNQTIEADEVQGAVEEVSNDSKPTAVLIDFGDDLYQEDKMFTILDSRVTADTNIIASKKIKDIGTRSKDESFVETFECSAESGNGFFNLYVKSLCGSVSGKFYINYSI